MALAAKLYRDERVADRQAVSLDATLRKPDRRPVDILIEDLSTTGFRFSTPEALELGSAVSIGISGLGRRDARVVREASGQYGCEFVHPASIAEIQAALTAQTIVQADFGRIPAGATDTPPLDAFEQRIRRFRGVIIGAGVVLPWMLLAGAARALFF